jgi:hypothetical protein
MREPSMKFRHDNEEFSIHPLSGRLPTTIEVGKTLQGSFAGRPGAERRPSPREGPPESGPGGAGARWRDLSGALEYHDLGIRSAAPGGNKKAFVLVMCSRVRSGILILET